MAPADFDGSAALVERASDAVERIVLGEQQLPG